MTTPIDHETDRLRILVWQERHFAPFAAINCDAEVMRYFPALQTEPPATLPCAPCVEIGWRIGRSFWGKGYATEGVRSCLRVAFGQLGASTYGR